MHFWRQLLFYIFLSIYLIITPLVILKMLGFIWHPASMRLVKTGLVTVSTIPLDANVLIDGKRAYRKTPTQMRDLAPGEHFIRIEKDGYLDWVGTFTIISNQVTALDSIELRKANHAL